MYQIMIFFRYISTKEYPYSKYPDFCQGAFYLFNLSTMEKLYDLFQTELHKNFIWMEDVFLTGIISNEPNMSIKNS